MANKIKDKKVQKCNCSCHQVSEERQEAYTILNKLADQIMDKAREAFNKLASTHNKLSKAAAEKILKNMGYPISMVFHEAEIYFTPSRVFLTKETKRLAAKHPKHKLLMKYFSQWKG